MILRNLTPIGNGFLYIQSGMRSDPLSFVNLCVENVTTALMLKTLVCFFFNCTVAAKPSEEIL